MAIKIKTTDEIRNKNFPGVSGGYGFPYTDSYNRQAAPGKLDLLKRYETTAYTCANLNANAIACCKLRLYAKSKSGQKVRFWDTANVNERQKQYLSESVKFRLSSNEDITEITNHPLLDLLQQPNEEISGYELFEITQLFQEIIGTAYWYVPRDSLGRPTGIYYLHSQFVRPFRPNGKLIHYDYGFGNQTQIFQPEELIVLSMASLSDNVEGYSPLRACWQSVTIDNKLDAQMSSMLDNNARPDLIVSPKGDGYIGQDEQLRYETRFNQKFKKAGNGGVLFTDEEMTITPLNFNPKDLGVLEFKHFTEKKLAAAFGVPMAMLETESVNKANLEGSRLQHSQNAVLPRARRFEARLNKHLVPLYDPSGRLFVCFDDPSPENRQEKLAEIVGLRTASIITVNEARSEYALAAHVDGDILYQPMPGLDLPETTTNDEEKPAEIETPTDEAAVSPGEPDASAASVQETALNGAQVSSLLEIVTQVVAGQLPVDSARYLIGSAFPALTAEQIDGILSPLEGFKPEAEPAPAAVKPPQILQDQQQDPEPIKDTPAPAKKLKAHKKPSLPTGQELIPILQKYYQKAEKAFLGQVHGSKGMKDLPGKFTELDNWTEDLADECRPMIELYLSEGGEALISRVGVPEDMFSVTNPHVAKAVDDAAFAFADSTLGSTTKQLNNALDTLKESLSESLTSGERLTEMEARVKEIFEGLTDSHARLIAETEASRAHHLGQRIAGEASGVVKGWKWLLSDDACEFCKKIAADNKKGIPLNGSFGKSKDDNPNPAYADIPYAPAHCLCRCAVTEILDSDVEIEG